MKTFIKLFPVWVLALLFVACASDTNSTENEVETKSDPIVTAVDAPVTAQGPTLDHSTSPESEWTAEVSPAEGLKVGDEFEVSFKAKVTDTNWHLYSSIPSDEMAYTPTEFFLFEDEAKDIEKVGGMSENVAPKEEFDDIMGGVVRYFAEKEITFTQKFKVTGPNPALQGEVFGQICLDPEAGGQCKPLRLPFTYIFSAE